MKRFTSAVLAMMLIAFAVPAIAGDGHDHGEKMKAKATEAKAAGMEKAAEAKSTEKDAITKAEGTMTLMGEIVDTGCYLGHGAMGEKHASCATKCIAGGMPMGLLTADGKLYLLTMNHDNPDAYNGLKKMAAKKVAVTGKTMERSGLKGLDVVSFKGAEVETDTPPTPVKGGR